ncbi:MAG: uracil-DNA glycosylase [Spirochaetales bacterium]|nr:uracil-DNA glycosylase [Spirochaetales bacterium]
MISRKELLEDFWKFLDLCEDYYDFGYHKNHPEPPVFPQPRKISPRETQLMEFYHKIEDCQGCLYRYNKGRGKIAQGPLSPGLCIVAMAPDLEPSQEDSVFSQKAGEYLEKWLEAIEINIQDVYCTHILKCRPPHKESKHWTESSICLELFKQQMELVKPKVLLSLGESAAQLLTNETEKSLHELEGGIYSFLGIPLFCTHHPYDVLKNPSLRSAVWADLKHLRSFMNQEKL